MEDPYKQFTLSIGPDYTGGIGDFSLSKFSCFELNPVYLFPIIMKLKYTPSNQLIIKTVIFASRIDIEETIQFLQQESPFKNQTEPRCMNEEDFSDEDLMPSMRVSSKIPYAERFSYFADEAIVSSEGDIQTVPSFPQGLSMKNPLALPPPMNMNMIRISEKQLLSVIPSIICVESENFYSPITLKAVLCEGEGASLKVVNSIAISGFTSVPFLIYSDIEHKNKAQVSKASDKVQVSLMSQSVLESIGTTSVSTLSFGYEYAVLLTSAGKIMTWGFGGSGCLGHSNTLSQSFPLLISDLLLENFVHIECGGYHTVAVSDKGDVYTWGRGDVHQLGISFKYLLKDDIGFYTSTPTLLKYFQQNHIHVVSGACGEAHTLLLDSEGKIYSFGWGEDGQLGVSRHLLNKAMISTQPNVLHITACKVKAGSLFSGCLTSEGDVYVWGNGEHGQLGQGRQYAQSDFPVKIEGLEAIDIQCGESHMICLDRNGRVWGWGAGRALCFADPAFPDGAEVVCHSPKVLNQVESVLHFKLDPMGAPSMILPDIDYQKRISELAEQLRVRFGDD